MLNEQQVKVKALLTEAITVLCKNGLSYSSNLQVEGLLGVTIDESEVFLISVNEWLAPGEEQKSLAPAPKPPPQQRQLPKPKPKPRPNPQNFKPAVKRPAPVSGPLSPRSPDQQLGEPDAKRFHSDDTTDSTTNEMKIKPEPGTEDETNDYGQMAVSNNSKRVMKTLLHSLRIFS